MQEMLVDAIKFVDQQVEKDLICYAKEIQKPFVILLA